MLLLVQSHLSSALMCELGAVDDSAHAAAAIANATKTSASRAWVRRDILSLQGGMDDVATDAQFDGENRAF